MPIHAEVLPTPNNVGKIGTMKKQKHLFVLGMDVIKSADDEEVRATLRDLREMDLYHLPYEREVYIQLNSNEIDPFNPETKDHALIYGPMDLERPKVVQIDTKSGRAAELTSIHPKPSALYFMATILRDLLVVFLATKNAERVTTENKLARLGIGKSLKHQFQFTTRISIPHELADDPDHPATGAKKAPHLRRGHIRRQHYGQGNLLEKKIWIAPIFVNADPEFVRERKAYYVSGH